jgi:hypothetical protein
MKPRALAMPSARRRRGFRALGARSTFFRNARTAVAGRLEQSASERENAGVRTVPRDARSKPRLQKL